MLIYTNTISDDIAIFQENPTQEQPCVLCKMFGKLDVHCKLIVTAAL